jgi:hypothetical protein
MVYILAGGFIHAERAAKQYGLTSGEWRFVVTERDLSEADPTRDTVIRGDTFFPRWVPNYSAIVAELTVRGFQWSES